MNRVRKFVLDSKPFMLIGTSFSSMQDFRRFHDENAFERRFEVAKKHVNFCLQLYNIQLKEGRHFVHEHPNCATSWLMLEVMALADTTGVMTTTCDMCAYGFKAQDEHGEALAQKRSRF